VQKELTSELVTRAVWMCKVVMDYLPFMRFYATA
jgi:hypothetical protein